MMPVLTEAALASVTAAVFTYVKDEAAKHIKDQASDYVKQQATEKVRSWLGRDPQQLAFQVAIARAYTSFARNYPQYAASLFDEHFLKNAAPLLARCIPWSEPPAPTELTTAWADQLQIRDAARQRYTTAVLPAAMDFLRFLRSELRARDEFQQDFDSIALDAIADSTAQMAPAIAALRHHLERALDQAAKYQVTIQEAKGLVVGDNATVTNVFQTFFDSTYATLQEYYIAPDEVFGRVRLDEFVGRPWLEADLNDFLSQNDRGAWLLVGEAGMGKTSFLAHLVRERSYLHFFAEQAPGDVNLPRALQSLAAQLISRFRLEPYHWHDSLPEVLSSYPDFLSRLLRLAAEQLGADERLVLVLDGLDEAGVTADGNVLGLPRQLPHKVYLILSQRPQPLPLRIEPLPHRVNLRAEEPRHQKHIAEYLQHIAQLPHIADQLQAQGCTSDDFVRILTEKSAGNWMYIQYVVDEIGKGQYSLFDVATLPSGLASHYAQFLVSWSERPDWQSLYVPVLATLAAAFEPLSVATLKRWAGIIGDDYAIHHLLQNDLAAYLYELDKEERRYGFYHVSLQKFFSGQLEIHFPPAVEILLDEMREQVREAHKRIVNNLLANYQSGRATLAANPYAHHYLTSHLRLAGMREDLFTLVDDRIWYDAQVEIDASGAAYLNDVTQAWLAAQQVNKEAIDGEQKAPLLSREIRCALISASLYNVSRKLPQKLPTDPVLSNFWSSTLMLAVLQNSELFERVQALIALTPHLPATERQMVLQQALYVARSLQDGNQQVQALIALAPHLPATEQQMVLQQALYVARSLQDGNQQVQALIALAPHLPATEQQMVLQQALYVARSLQDGNQQVQALIALAPHLPATEQQMVLQQALYVAQAIESPALRVQALTALVPYLPQAEQLLVLHQASSVTHSSNNDDQALDDEQQVQALIALVPYLAQLAPANLYSMWYEALHLLAVRPRRKLLLSLGALSPIITKLGGEKVMSEVVQTIQEVEQWWP